MFEGLWDKFACVFIELINDVIALIASWFDAALKPIVEALPDLDLSVDFLAPYLNFLDLFFDYRYAISVFTSFCIVVLLILLIKWILGLIPTVS